MNDLISRQATIDAIDKHIDAFDAIDTNYLCGLRTAMSFLKEMPSAEPENTCEKTCEITRMSQEKDTIYRQDVIDMIQGVPISSGTTKAMLIFRAKEVPSAQPELSDDGTLMMTVPHGILSDVKRVMVDEVGTKFCKTMYQDQPERKKGRWIIDKDCEGKSRTVTCNLCGHKEFNWHDPNYCENCGADMRGEQNGND